MENLGKDSKARANQMGNNNDVITDQIKENIVDDDFITKSVDVMRMEYPFIFTLQGMNTHCRLLLTGQKDCHGALHAFFVNGDATITMKYLTSNSKQKFGCINLESRSKPS